MCSNSAISRQCLLGVLRPIASRQRNAGRAVCGLATDVCLCSLLAFVRANCCPPSGGQCAEDKNNGRGDGGTAVGDEARSDTAVGKYRDGRYSLSAGERSCFSSLTSLFTPPVLPSSSLPPSRLCASRTSHSLHPHGLSDSVLSSSLFFS